MSWVGFETTIPALERTKTFHGLDHAVTVIGPWTTNIKLIWCRWNIPFFQIILHRKFIRRNVYVYGLRILDPFWVFQCLSPTWSTEWLGVAEILLTCSRDTRFEFWPMPCVSRPRLFMVSLFTKGQFRDRTSVREGLLLSMSNPVQESSASLVFDAICRVSMRKGQYSGRI
jgi:hypothetical protein